ncbi:MAG: flagellar hook-length control protein FliK [Burkholderiales bacterium]|nr:flagellar hook-length control protein FliK [Burkholderiales bacterium]
MAEVQAKPAPGSASLLLNSMLFAKPSAPSTPTPPTKNADGLFNMNTNLGLADPVSSGPATQAQPATISTNSRSGQALFASNLSAGQPVSALQTAHSLAVLSSLVIEAAEPKTDSRDKKTLRLSAQDEAPPTAASASTLLLTSLPFPNSPPPLTQPTSSTGLASEQTVFATPQPISRSAPALPAASALPTQVSTRSAPALPELIAAASQPAKTPSLEGPKSVSIVPITPPATTNTQPVVGVTAHAAAQTLQAGQAPEALAAAQVLAGSISAAWVAAKSATSSQAAELGPDMRLDASAEESVQDAVRLTLSLPAPDLSKRLSSRPGNTEVLNWAPLLANQQPNANKAPASGPWENLHLAVPEGFDLEEQERLLAAPEQDSGNNAGQPTQAGPLARGSTEPAQTARGEAAQLAAQAELRTTQQQQLADRLGEAAAHRLIAQIERGEWKMQMRLQPGKLGRIDVELSMHARGLEAMFSADSALTRELIVQGTARLKETLAQAGMTVASMTVNGDQTRQSGGNSTPQQGYKAASDALPTKARVEEPRAVVQTPVLTATDRLNILA